MKSLLLFLATFALGAFLALATRTLRHDPHSAAPGTDIPGSAGFQPASAPHGEHTPPAAPVTINTTCPICGMDVDPSLPPATYQGKQVGFGCAACPPRFAKEPERYGPSALRNEVAP